MAENKTLPNDADPVEFIEKISSINRKKDAYQLLELFKKITRHKPVMWGPSIIGFGSYHYKYESGREGVSPLTGFSPRSNRHVLYVLNNFPEQEKLLAQLGKYKTGRVCLYINKLGDVDIKVLEDIINQSVDYDLSKSTYKS